MARIRWFALPIVALPLYSIAASLQACSGGIVSSAGPEGSTSEAGAPELGTPEARASSCIPGVEEVKRLTHGNVCCKPAPSGDGSMSCRAPGDAQVGDPCPILGATSPGATYAATFDVCVQETCAGDRTCTEFPLTVEKRSGTLRCVNDGVQNAWVWDGIPATHFARRACLLAESYVCSGPGYSYPFPGTLGYAPGSFDGDETTCSAEYPGYPLTYDYRGARRLAARRLFLAGSFCSVAGGVPTPCPLDDL